MLVQDEHYHNLP